MGKKIWTIFSPRVSGAASVAPECFTARSKQGVLALHPSKALADRHRGKYFEVVTQPGMVGLRRGFGTHCVKIGTHGIRSLVLALESVGYEVEDKSRWEMAAPVGGVYGIFRALPDPIDRAGDEGRGTKDEDDSVEVVGNYTIVDEGAVINEKTLRAVSWDLANKDHIAIIQTPKEWRNGHVPTPTEDIQNAFGNEFSEYDISGHPNALVDAAKELHRQVVSEDGPPLSLNGNAGDVEAGSVNKMVEPESLKPEYRGSEGVGGKGVPRDEGRGTRDEAETVVTPKVKSYRDCAAPTKFSMCCIKTTLPSIMKCAYPRGISGGPRDWVLALKYMARGDSAALAVDGTVLSPSEGEKLFDRFGGMIETLKAMEAENGKSYVNDICEELEQYWRKVMETEAGKA